VIVQKISMNVKRYNLVKQHELVLIYQEHINAIVLIVLVDKIVKWYEGFIFSLWYREKTTKSLQSAALA
jgi:hypothetical protein